MQQTSATKAQLFEWKQTVSMCKWIQQLQSAQCTCAISQFSLSELRVLLLP